MACALTFDLEHWYDATLAQGARGDPAAVVRETDALLELLAAHRARATFFVLGHVAQDQPALVARVAALGHEIACHGWDHTLLTQHTPRTLAVDLGRAKDLLEQLSGRAVVGYRAPTWSLDARTAWAVGVLAELGFHYDSSLFPCRTGLYGVPGAPLRPFHLRACDAEILEFPPAVWAWGRLRVPVAGGIFWRLLPTSLVLAACRGWHGAFTVGLHPWELTPTRQEGVAQVPLRRRWTLTWGRRRAVASLTSLLASFPCQALGEMLAAAQAGDVWSLA